MDLKTLKNIIIGFFDEKLYLRKENLFRINSDPSENCDIADKGIAIETNPSSSFLLGISRQYEKHPIICFYDKGLTRDPAKLREWPPIHVSVNADDQGVFNTSIENEQALLASALELLTDQDDRSFIQ